MNVLQQFRSAARDVKRPLTGVLVEALRLRLGRNQLGVTEYLDYGLHRTDLSFEQKSRFCGVRLQSALEELLVDDYSKFLSLDKVSMGLLLKGGEFRTPEIFATFGRLPRANLPHLQTDGELRAFLNHLGRPVYIKPAYGAFGRGNVLVQAFEGSSLVLGDGSRVTIESFVTGLKDPSGLGWMLQEPMRAHRDLIALTGNDKVSGVRIHTFADGTTVSPWRAVFKINNGLRDSDNFDHGHSGNWQAAVDLSSGRLTRIGAGYTLLAGRPGQSSIKHPQTQQELLGVVLPDWDQLVDLARRAHRAFPGFIFPGWDIAITDAGPVILEANMTGDVDLPQMAHRTGFMDAALLAMLERRGLLQMLYAAPRNRSRSRKNHRLGGRKHHWPW